MTQETQQQDAVFTCKGALMGLVAYITVAIIVAWIFLR